MWFIGRNFGSSSDGQSNNTRHTSTAVSLVSAKRLRENIPQVITCGCDDTVQVLRPILTATPGGTLRIPGQWDRSLRGFYPLGEYGGNDLSTRGNHAAAATDPLDLVPGHLCELAERMDGRQYFRLPFDLDDSITVSLWVKLENAKLEQTVLSVGDNLRFGFSWLLEPIIWLAERTPEEAVISGDALQPSQWYHVTFVRDCEVYRVYIDGQQVSLNYEGEPAEQVIAPTQIDPGPASISLYREASGLHGTFQDVAIREAALDPGEIQAEHDSYCSAVFDLQEI